MLLLDAVWLSANAATSRQVMAAIQGRPMEIRYAAAAAVYALMIAGVWYFAVRPAISVADAAVRGAGLGALMYGVYDFTNHATITGFPLSYAVRDFAWGIALCASVAAAGAFVSRL